jgi:hypothetical protein
MKGWHDKGTVLSRACHGTLLVSVTQMTNYRHGRPFLLSLFIVLSFSVRALAADPSPMAQPESIREPGIVVPTEGQPRKEPAVAQGLDSTNDLTPTATPRPAASTPMLEKKAEWYETLKIRGYTQVRYNRLPTFDDNDALINDQGDKYIGGGSGFAIRRARVIIYGDVHPLVSVYLQTDFASAVGEQNHVAIVRDWYADVALNTHKEFRLRIGQSKVPYGFENLQSSQNRLAFDRNDALNSAVKDERDLGVFAYWAPAQIRKRFKHLVDNNLKGSGDYGVVGVGAYNGQTANRFDRNDNLHVVARISYPLKFGEQFVELGLGGYTGLFTVNVASAEGGPTYRVRDGDGNMRDARASASLVLYPQPFGIQAEYNIGKGPQQTESDPSLIATRSLRGGYAQMMYKVDNPFGTISLIPYVRGTLYEGGKKFETNTPRYDVKELELGLEWQLIAPLEVTMAYAFADRTSSKAPYTARQGQLLRAQVQFNY